MRPIRTKDTTMVLGAPKDWDADRLGPCEGLPIAVGDGFMCSFWKPTRRERLAILFGRSIRLGVSGVSHPPVWLDTEN